MRERGQRPKSENQRPPTQPSGRAVREKGARDSREGEKRTIKKRIRGKKGDY